MSITREQAADMAEAHAEGLHAELPREGCPECEGRPLRDYPRSGEVVRRYRRTANPHVVETERNTNMSKNDLIDAAVEFVMNRAGEQNEYIEAYAVASHFKKIGLFTHPEADATDYTTQERVRKSLDGKAKRLLDEEVTRPNARILRFSSRDHDLLPRLDGTRRGLYGQAVGYTTPEVYQRAVAAVEAASAQHQAEADEMKALLQRAAAAGLPEPTQTSALSVTYDVAGLRRLIERVDAR